MENTPAAVEFGEGMLHTELFSIRIPWLNFIMNEAKRSALDKQTQIGRDVGNVDRGERTIDWVVACSNILRPPLVFLDKSL